MIAKVTLNHKENAYSDQFQGLISKVPLHLLMPDDFIANEVKDTKITSKTYYYFKNDAINNESLLNFLRLEVNKFQVFQRGEDTALYCDKDHQYIFANTNYRDVVKKLYITPEDYSYSLVFRTAEYHSYIELKDLVTNHTLTFGVAPKQKGSMYSDLYIRNDSYYTPKYSTGDKFLKNGEYNPHFNKGSISITFPLNKEKAKQLIANIQKHNAKFHSESHKYDFLGYFGKNCADFAYDIIESVGIDPTINHYFKTDELDLRDQGVMYHVWKDLGTFKYAWNMPKEFIDTVSNFITGSDFDRVSESMLSKLGYYNIFTHSVSSLIPAAYRGDVSKIRESVEKINIANFAGETPLHIALQNGNFDFADLLFALGADVNLKDAKGQAALHVIAAQKTSEIKNNILKSLCKLGNDVNAADNINIKTPLTNAVLSDDPEAVKILIECGANVSYVNENKDNIINIAVLAGKFKTINLLHSKDQNLIYYDNLEHQIPICEIAKQSNPNIIINGFDELWSSFDQSNCKQHSDLYSHLDL